MATSRKATQPAEPENFEKALEELEQLVEHMESGEPALDTLLANYQRGAQLISYCREKLKKVEQQVKILEDGELKAFPSEGNPK